jgi:hypothetical protein
MNQILQTVDPSLCFLVVVNIISNKFISVFSFTKSSSSMFTVLKFCDGFAQSIARQQLDKHIPTHMPCNSRSVFYVVCTTQH